MITDYLTIPEASVFAGKPEITIRRFIKRMRVQKNFDSALIKKQKIGKRFQYIIAKKLLIDEYHLASDHPVFPKHAEYHTDDQNDHQTEPCQDTAVISSLPVEHPMVTSLEKTIGILQAQLEVKDRQIERMQELVRNEQVLSLQRPSRPKGFFAGLFGRRGSSVG